MAIYYPDGHNKNIGNCYKIRSTVKFCSWTTPWIALVTRTDERKIANDLEESHVRNSNSSMFDKMKNTMQCKANDDVVLS